MLKIMKMSKNEELSLGFTAKNTALSTSRGLQQTQSTALETSDAVL